MSPTTVRCSPASWANCSWESRLAGRSSRTRAPKATGAGRVACADPLPHTRRYVADSQPFDCESAASSLGSARSVAHKGGLQCQMFDLLRPASNDRRGGIPMIRALCASGTATAGRSTLHHRRLRQLWAHLGLRRTLRPGLRHTLTISTASSLIRCSRTSDRPMTERSTRGGSTATR